MNAEWSLDILYKGFDDPDFKNDLKNLENVVEECNVLSKNLSHSNEKENLISIISVLERLEVLVRKLDSFASLSLDFLQIINLRLYSFHIQIHRPMIQSFL